MSEVRTIAVIGAGIMGRGIAHAAALGGYRTILEDLLPGALRKAETEIRANLDKAVELGKVTAPAADSAIKRLEYAGSVEEAARDADLIIEAVPEEMESKIRDLHTPRQNLPTDDDAGLKYFFSQRDGNCQRDLPREKGRCVGMHFFNPSPQNEVARSGARSRNRR